MRGGQPSTTTPMPPPCDSPKVVTRKSWPKVLPMCVCHFDCGDESLNSRKRATTKPAIVLPRTVSVIPSESRGISNYFLEKPRDVSTSLDMTKEMSAITRLFWGAHAPSRADFGASPKSSSPNKKKSLASCQRQHARCVRSPKINALGERVPPKSLRKRIVDRQLNRARLPPRPTNAPTNR